MKRLTKILLRIGAFLSLFVGVQLLGFAFFAPAMHTEGLGVELLTDQLLAASGGRGRLTMAGAAATILCIVLQRMVRTVRQAESDAKARQLLSEVREDKPPSYSYFLYLRAFETTRRLKAPLFLLDLSTFGLNRLWNNELEGHINGALLKVGPLIALGHPGENFGAGRVTTSDEEWMTDIAKLARNARGILLIPSHRGARCGKSNTCSKKDC